MFFSCICLSLFIDRLSISCIDVACIFHLGNSIASPGRGIQTAGLALEGGAMNRVLCIARARALPLGLADDT